MRQYCVVDIDVAIPSIAKIQKLFSGKAFYLSNLGLPSLPDDVTPTDRYGDTPYLADGEFVWQLIEEITISDELVNEYMCVLCDTYLVVTGGSSHPTVANLIGIPIINVEYVDNNVILHTLKGKWEFTLYVWDILTKESHPITDLFPDFISYGTPRFDKQYVVSKNAVFSRSSFSADELREATEHKPFLIHNNVRPDSSLYIIMGVDDPLHYLIHESDICQLDEYEEVVDETPKPTLNPDWIARPEHTFRFAATPQKINVHREYTNIQSVDDDIAMLEQSLSRLRAVRKAASALDDTGGQYKMTIVVEFPTQ